MENWKTQPSGKSYTANIQIRVVAGDDHSAKSEAEAIVLMLDQKFDNRARLVSLYKDGNEIDLSKVEDRDGREWLESHSDVELEDKNELKLDK